MTLILHYAPDNASLIVRLALEEMGLPYRTTLVDRRSRAQDSPAYRRLNPAGTIPALETPQGTISETQAILLWLTEHSGQLAPAPHTPERLEFLRWMAFCSNTVQALLRVAFYPEKFIGPDPAAQSALRAQLMHRDGNLGQAIALLEAHVAALGPEAPLTVLDYYMACLLRWCVLYPTEGPRWFDLAAHPALTARLHWLEGRPAVHAAQSAEGLGPHPFTAPQLADPPEGSAL